MARTVEQIYNSMVEEKQTFSQLSGLMPTYTLSGPTPDNPFRLLLDEINNNSTMGIWRAALLIVAFAIHNFEKLQDAFRAEVDEVAAQSIAGNRQWYAAQILKWQYGFS